MIHFSKKYLFDKINFPLFLLLLVHIFHFIDYQQRPIYATPTQDLEIKTYLVLIWMLYLFGIFLKNITRLNLGFLLLVNLFSVLSIYNIFISFNTQAAIESLMKMSFPLLAVIYGILHKESIKAWMNGLIFLTIINDIVQIVIYLLHFTGLYVFKLRLEDHFLIRAEGLVGFTSFAVMNFISAILVNSYYHGKHNKKLFWFFIVMTILPFLFKLLPLLLIYLMVVYVIRKKTTLFLTIFLIIIVSILYGKDNFVYQKYRSRINQYSLYGDSIRVQSYRVAKKSIIDNSNMLGEGLGSFGGPASIKYNSPLYRKYNFNFGWMDFLTTTDTYYPHLLVEMGLIGFLSFFAILLYPVNTAPSQTRSQSMWFVLLIPLNNAFTAFSIEDPTVVMFTFALVPMILFQHNHYRNVPRQMSPQLENK